MSNRHWVIVAVFFAGTASVIGGYDHWGDLLKPSVFAGLLSQFAAGLMLLFQPPPNALKPGTQTYKLAELMKLVEKQGSGDA